MIEPAETAYDDAEPLAFDTSKLPRLSKSNPNGVAPTEAYTRGVPARPSGPTAYVSIVCEPFSVTTSVSPPGENDTCAGVELPVPSGCVELASGVRESAPTVKPVMLPAPPALSTYSDLPCTVRLIGRTPPEATVAWSSRPPGRTEKSETELLPALTAKSCRLSLLRAMAPCEPSPAPVPVPPVGNVPCGASVPSAERSNAITAFPAGEFVSVYTAPGLLLDAEAIA